MTFISGADGPTAVFLVGKLGPGWLNLSGLILVALLLVPNMVYAVKYRDAQNRCTNMLMNGLEQIGRYGSMFLMIFNIGIAELGFSSVSAFLIYGAGNIVLMAAYWILWWFFFKKPAPWNRMALAVLPTMMFLLSGATMRHYLLVAAGVVFGIGHGYVTWQNR